MGYYFLAHTSDIKNIMTWDRELWSSGAFNAFSLGLNFNLNHFSIQGDASCINKKHWFYYGKLYVPVTKTHLGLSLSNYDTYIDSSRIVFGIVNERIGETDRLKIDKFDVSTSAFKFFNFGFRYFKLLRARYVPNINFALHQFYDIERHIKMPIDIEVFFETEKQRSKKNGAGAKIR